MIKLNINYSKEFEQKRIKDTIRKLDWYKINGYSWDLLSFPKACSISELTKLSDDDLLKLIAAEYNENKFVSASESLLQTFNIHSDNLEQFIIQLDLPVIPELNVFLTGYGISGSYSPPNSIITNIERRFGIGLLKTVLHEAIHLHIQDLIIRHKIGQWAKEKLVDLLFEQAFPDICRKQNIPIDTKMIEEIFAIYYPNIKKIILLLETAS